MTTQETAPEGTRKRVLPSLQTSFLFSSLMKPFSSIRTRLIVIIIVFTVLPAAFIGVLAATLGAKDTRNKVGDSLEAVAALKEDQVNSWIEDLGLELVAEIERDSDTHRMVRLLNAESNTIIFQTLYNIVHSIFESSVASRQAFDELFLLDMQGNVVISTDLAQEGKNYNHRAFFRRGIEEPYLQPFQYELSLGRLSMIMSRPMLNDQGRVVGVLAGRVNPAYLDAIMLNRTGLGDTGETYLVGANGLLLTQARSPASKVGETYVSGHSVANENLASEATAQSSEYPNYEGILVIGAYRWIPEIQASMLAEQHQVEAYSTLRTTTNLIILAGTLALLAAIFAAVLTSRNLTQPLIELTSTTERIAQGNLELSADTRRSDEIGALAQAFNSMTSQLRSLIGSLEQRVAERTRQLQNRSEQLLTAAEVGRSAATILESDILIQRVVNLIQQRFNLYYVGLFQVDQGREWAVLRAGTGQAGRAMLQRGHRLKLDESSMIGWCITNAKARIALEAETDPVRLATPDLPETRSEAAIPLRSRGQVLGAISIQSTQPGAFDQEAIAVFQTMADQVGVALDNARLFADAQAALETAQQAYGEINREVWLERLHAKPLAFRRDSSGFRSVETASAHYINLEEHSDGDLLIPIKTRGHTIGYLNAQKQRTSAQEGPDWNPEEIGLLELLTDQLGVALDSARLFEETQEQAERERLVDEVTSRMRATLDIENVLQTAVREMRSALELDEVEVRIGIAPGSGAKATQPPESGNSSSPHHEQENSK